MQEFYNSLVDSLTIITSLTNGVESSVNIAHTKASYKNCCVHRLRIIDLNFNNNTI